MNDFVISKEGDSWILPDGKIIRHDELLSYYLEKTEASIQQNIDEKVIDKVKYELWLVVKIYFVAPEKTNLIDLSSRIFNALGSLHKVQYAFYMGHIFEGMRNYQKAALWYSKANDHIDSRINDFIKYFIKNNLGYCLNILERFTEAEALCRDAIIIDPDRHNAHKNLGVSLQAQGKLSDAARSFIRATLLCPADKRALAYLENIMNGEMGSLSDYEDIKEQFLGCKAKVNERGNLQS